ncbi:ribonuclease H-like [Chrysemys picta bellii]|uniref:ribonuclease H-like n=1 Tax=Chrysemys picta bellii TaxID=8478 RepID=UPI0032B16EF6
MGQERHIWYTDGSSMVVHGKKRIRYAAINLEEEVLKGYLDHGSAQHAELHAIYPVLKQYEIENCPKTVYIYADSNYCVNGVQYWMFDWQRNNWKATDGEKIAYIDEWKWIYAWVTSHPNQLKIKHVKAHGKGSAAETV